MMKITYATVHVRIGAPYNKTLSKPFKVKDGQGFMTQGMKLGNIMLMEFVENHFDRPTAKDYKKIAQISEIKVNRFKF